VRTHPDRPAISSARHMTDLAVVSRPRDVAISEPRYPAQVLAVQRAAGNRATTALLHARGIVVQRDAVDDWDNDRQADKKRQPQVATLDQQVELVLGQDDQGKLVYRLKGALDKLDEDSYKKFKVERAAVEADLIKRLNVAVDTIERSAPLKAAFPGAGAVHHRGRAGGAVRRATDGQRRPCRMGARCEQPRRLPVPTPRPWRSPVRDHHGRLGA
jgi:hypothetical protein